MARNPKATPSPTGVAKSAKGQANAQANAAARQANKAARQATKGKGNMPGKNKLEKFPKVT